MRFKVIFKVKGEKGINIHKEYRRFFLSFLKNVFKNSGIFSELYSSKKVKPFTFSVFLGKDFEILNEGIDGKVKSKPPLSLIFSSGDPEILLNFYNGVLEMKKNKKGIALSKGISLPLEEIILLPKKNIKTSCSIFKTVGVSVITDPQENSKNFDKWFCVPEKGNLDRFNKVLEKRMIEKYERIKGKKLHTKIKLTPVTQKEMEIFIRQGKLNPSFGTKPVKEVYIKHYGGFIRGFKGVFYLESHPEMLQFIYDYGLGVRTGQGFGLLEVIAQI